MCGIIGYVGTDARARAANVQVARDEMVRRGPDDAGLWIDDAACLGARRLSILDLSPAGHMPMESTDGGLVIVFNGAIYNFLELREELVRQVPFRSTGDTEVILNGFRAWGWHTLLDRLDGMFAFAIWDVRERVLYAARDRMGEKPFFYARSGDSLAFASTLGALLRLRPTAPRVNLHALDAYLTYQAVPAPFAIVEGVSQLRPAHAIRFDAARGRMDVERYWDVAYAPKRRMQEREAVDTIDALARQSVRTHLRSDVPTGTLLSGGVDSSLVTMLASQESTAPLDAVTMGFDTPEHDERQYARAVAERAGACLHEEVLAPALVADLPAIIAEYGQPVADVSIVPNYYMARAAKRVMTVALVGDGADEVFGGYARPLVERAAVTYRQLVPSLMRRGIAAVLAEPVGRRSTGSLRRRLGLLASAGAHSARDAYVYDRAFRSLRATAYSPAFLSAVADWNPDDLHRAAWQRAVAADDVDRALYGDLVTYLPDQLLAKSDVSAMAFSLEARSPFLARELVEFSATIPTSLRLRHFTTKYLLKRVAERYVPAEAIYRRKRGFVMPAASWLRGPLAPILQAAVDSEVAHDRGWINPDATKRLIAEHMDGTHDWSEQLWTLLVLEVWARMTLDRTLSAGDSLDALLLAEGAR